MTHAILLIANKFQKAIENKMYSCGIFLDLSETFGTVNHTILEIHACSNPSLAKHATIFSEHEVIEYIVVIATRQFLFFLYIFSQQREKGHKYQFLMLVF